ncbi:MAG: ABC transporter ATP-binding protein [Firmicutes bacterium]|nr:ABC transporter ATP-binding protein [Bacillota bacterium]
MSEPILVLDNLKKSFGDVSVLRGINLEAQKGEFITLLGSSGCGKTTTLRIIAGLETPDSGRVILNGVDVTEAEPNRRNVNTVFQNYALFPHMNVETNIAYSLKLKKVKAPEIRKAVTDALALVQLEGFEKRMPSELSGGQRQRVAIARAIVNQPDVLLLDEPLGALDLKLRRQMQLELKKLQKTLGITFIYITHDQEEALNMSDRIAVMRNGVFEQVGTPSEVYELPKTAYVANFVGSANIINGVCEAAEGSGSEIVGLTLSGGRCEALRRGFAGTGGEPVTVAVRSENVRIHPADSGTGLSAEVTDTHFAGGMLRISTRLADGTEIVISRYGIDTELKAGAAVRLDWAPENAVIVETDSGAPK